MAGVGASQRRRLRLYELEPGFHCSIVGTCLTPGMARQIVRRAKLSFDHDTQDYRLHSVLVGEAGRPGIVSRLITKSLDQSFAGVLRRVGATSGAEELGSLWDELCEKGEVAAGYWALLTHAHVPAELRIRIFGEVHMLSHFMGGHNRASAKALWLAERRAEQLAERLVRGRRQARATLAERDRRIAELEAELAATRTELAQRVAVSTAQRRRSPRRGAEPARIERRVLATRARLREAEQENARLRRQLDLLTEEPASPAPIWQSPALPPCGEGPERCLLYVGGHCSLMPHLRRHARTRRLELLHHDGGEEHSLHVLEGLVGRAEAVFCPIDCVSHQACLAAKQLCRRLDKPFVPLRTGSGTCFLRAIDHWRVSTAPVSAA
ncbi:MAG: DUF2325 domain-containing protein [Geminicoccaceae bacterium]